MTSSLDLDAIDYLEHHAEYLTVAFCIFAAHEQWNLVIQFKAMRIQYDAPAHGAGRVTLP